MAVLEILRGVPASGKSTYAAERVVGGAVRVNRDNIRETMFGKPWGVDEDVVTVVEHAQITAALVAGHDVVVDATNLNSKSVSAILRLASAYHAEVKYTDFPIAMSEAIDRDTARGWAGARSVGGSTIRRFFKRYKLNQDGGTLGYQIPQPEYGAQYTPNPKLPRLYTFDLDRTLAIHNGRNPYDTSRYMEDLPNTALVPVVNALSDQGIDIGILTGRDARYRQVCEDWLRHNGIQFDHVWMREAKDQRGDDIIKTELFDEWIDGEFNHLAHWDDRTRVVRALRSKGITVYHVIPENEGNF